MGAADDWTPPAPCQKLVAENTKISITLFPGAYHDFDVPNDPVHEIKGLPYAKNGGGVAHAGENAVARVAAEKIVPESFAALAG
jgi:dienelactone hydrolase